MDILLNGEPFGIEENCSIAELIKRLNLTQKRLAVEVNCEIVSRSQFDTHQLAMNDKVEIVQAIGGG